ncbi:hypothetical protein G5B38_16480 [Pseudohalocynthiibacter aestuariivivens]|uniref:DUF6473 family protein n=2 Tax=Roseovarius pelagicus TaxID=2980108 RepID=A0ABY6DG17_9RHOB|nr:DUF6473 family protein [Pseudohalocynthiibacter aestuariivivens]QIE47627.1 hypothetical protein G5B38_16480 [Pseudohalocynthiibacter aestuariivivens]UXX85117.1 DUF6473 family protein [Roseovarius pelagicus]
MAYEKLGDVPLNYMPCRYGASKLRFRGPRRRLSGRYAAFLGGTETYGKFIAHPFPALVEARTGVKCVNLGWSNAGIDVFLHDPDILAAAARAQVTVLQVLPAQNMSNRFYSVHPRRNDRFVEASPVLRSVYREVDFTEFHFTRHMLHRLRAVSEERFALVREELQTAWVARMKLLLHHLGSPVVLLWLSSHGPGEVADQPSVSSDPAFVTAGMLEALRPQVLQIIDATARPEALACGTDRMVFSQFEVAAASELLGPAAHEDAAEALVPVIGELVGG